ncbi:Tc toxin subunit A [Enterobacter asburiae]
MVDNTAIPGLSLPLDNITIKAIKDAGYRNIIDIISESETLFVQKLASVEHQLAKNIYKKASAKMAELFHIYRALQARRNPLVQQISKLGVSTQPEGLMNALERSLNNGPDYEHLFPVRDEFYAPEDSIQSLFSPGRYLTELYSISRGLHAVDSVLNIDKRLPVMASLPLSQISMDRVIPALTILNSITNISDSLSTTTWPMTLPYDDNLAQIRCALPVSAASLQGVWSALSDAQWQSFAPIVFVPPVPADDRTPSPATREELGFMPGAYNLLTSEAATADGIQTRYHLDTAIIATELQSIDTFTDSTALSFNQLLEMTGQADYQTADADGLFSTSRYYAYSDTPAEIAPVPVTTYGQTYLSSVDGTPTNDTPMLVVPDATPETYKLDFTDDGVATRLADKAERLLRLQRQMNLEYAQLDWLIKNINQAITRTSNWKLDTTVLDALAVFSRLASRYSISADGFACFIGTMNTYGRAEQKSLFERLFTSPVTQQVAKLNGDVDFSLQTASYDAALICGGLGVTANELFEMSQLAFGAATVVKMSANKYAQLYRLAIIPRMLGISFTEARTLWTLLDPSGGIERTIAAAVPILEILDIITQTESVLGWMESCQLEVTDVVGLLSANYPTEPTPEVFNFLNTLYSGLRQEEGTPANAPFRDMMCRLIGSTFQVKANVMSLLIDWQDLWFTGTTTPYTLTEFWTEIKTTFAADGVSIDSLYSTPDLVRYSYGLAQYAAIATTFSLTEQDLQLLVTYPEWFFDGHTAVTGTPRQSFPVLLLLTRFKAWQQRVVTGTEDALGYFSWVNQTEAPDEAAALGKLAEIHNWDTGTAAAMNDALSANLVYPSTVTHPTNFQLLNRLDTWMRTGEQLNTSTTCIDQLSTLSRPEIVAGDESRNLSNVAKALVASTVRPSED